MRDVSRLAQVRARLDLPIARRAAGLLEGRHQSILKGHGQDFDDLHLYSPGEDVGDIDWKASARSGQPVVRRFVRESNLTLVLVVDTGRTMGATAPSGETKGEVAAFCCALVAYIARDRGDRVALVAGDAERLDQTPPRASTADLEALLALAESMWRPDAPANDLTRPLARAVSAYRSRSLMVVVTDEARPGPAEADQLRMLRVRHEVIVVRIADLSPFASDRTTADVDGTPELPNFLRRRAGLVAATQREADRRRADVEETLRTLKIQDVVIGGTDDVVRRFVELLGRQKHARR